jgi:hypothetical protein
MNSREMRITRSSSWVRESRPVSSRGSLVAVSLMASSGRGAEGLTSSGNDGCDGQPGHDQADRFGM